jgi:hypothetical protein
MKQAHTLPNTTNADQLRIRKESAKVRKHCQAQSAIELKDQLSDKMQRALLRKEAQIGFLHYRRLQNTAWHCTKVLFVMLSA